MRQISNNVDLLGHLGNEVEFKCYENGTKKASCTLATNEQYKNNKGELIKKTEWHKIVAWGKNAEMMSKVLSKGSLVKINGSLTTRKYTKENTEVMVTEIMVHEFFNLSKNKWTTEEQPMVASY
jgi:single-strand DNA-binding protein